MATMLHHWRLTRNPFASDGEYFLAARCEEALARLLFVVEQRRRLGAVTGPERIGKSRLLSEVRHATARPNLFTATIDATGCHSFDLAVSLARAAGCARSKRDPWEQLLDLFYGWQAIGMSCVWCIDQFDDASVDLTGDVLRLVRLLDQTRVPGSVLVAAHAFSDARWREAVDLSVALERWTAAECREFVVQRLEAAGAGREVFTPAALMALAEIADGVPGRLMRFGELVLQAGWTLGVDGIDAELVRSIAAEIEPSKALCGSKVAAAGLAAPVLVRAMN